MSVSLKYLSFCAACSLVMASAAVAAISAAAQGRTESKETKFAGADNIQIIRRTPVDDTIDAFSAYKCELGIELKIYDANDEFYILLEWDGQIHRLERVRTNSGARRFESDTAGLVWITIPTKGILLDLKLHQPLANECKNSEAANRQGAQNDIRTETLETSPPRIITPLPSSTPSPAPSDDQGIHQRGPG